MAELLACPKLPDTRRRSGSATIAMPGSRSAVIQRLATAGAAAGMMERPTHHLFEMKLARRDASRQKREKFVNVPRSPKGTLGTSNEPHARAAKGQRDQGPASRATHGHPPEVKG